MPSQYTDRYNYDVVDGENIGSYELHAVYTVGKFHGKPHTFTQLQPGPIESFRVGGYVLL